MEIDFSPLESAISQLEKSITFATSEMAEKDLELFEQFRNSVIQCFEFTYELSHKMLKRYLEETAANPEEIDLSTFQNIIRIGNEKGLLRSDWSEWKGYRLARSTSSLPMMLIKLMLFIILLRISLKKQSICITN